MCSEKNIDGIQNFAMVPKIVAKVVIWPFLDLKNDEKSSFEKICQRVWVPFWVPFGYHWGTILGTILGTIMKFMMNFENQKIDFLRFSTFTSVLWVPNGTQSGIPIVPKIFSL